MSDEVFYGSFLPVVAFFALGGIFGLLERKEPARDVDWRRTFGLDVLGLAIYWSSVPVFSAATMTALAPLLPRFAALVSVPLFVRAAAYFMLSDMARYATHCAMHAGIMWRTHRFHHSPTQLYWFSGNRATPVHVFLFLFPQLFFGLLFSIPKELVFANVVIGQIWNNLMHTNWNPSARWQRRFEWLVTTPRYHAIHHAVGPALANKNLASIFTVWDRLFGKYVDPDSVDTANLEFGADEQAAPRYRMVLGA